MSVKTRPGAMAVIPCFQGAADAGTSKDQSNIINKMMNIIPIGNPQRMSSKVGVKSFLFHLIAVISA